MFVCRFCCTQNKNNQENAKVQKLATQQLGGIRTATEAAKVNCSIVKNESNINLGLF